MALATYIAYNAMHHASKAFENANISLDEDEGDDW